MHDEIDLMGDTSQDQILARLDDARFVDREAGLTAFDRFSDNIHGLNRLLLGARHVGKTEILLRLFDHLFRRGGLVVPVYFPFRGTGVDAKGITAEFINQLMRQVIAFRSRDPQFLKGSDGPQESFGRHTDRDDVSWVRSLKEIMGTGSGFENFFSAPQVVAAYTGLRPLVMLDNIHRAEEISVDLSQPGVAPSCPFTQALLEALSKGAGGSSVSLVLSGLERPLAAMIPADEDILQGLRLTRLERLGDRLVEEVIRREAAFLGVEVSDSTTELMVQQLRGDLFYVRTLLDAAAASGTKLKTFVDFEKLYTAELLSGRIAQYFGALLRASAPGFQQQRAVIETLRLLIEAGGPVSLDAVIERIRRYCEDPEALLLRLNRAELLDLEYGFASASRDLVAADYVRAVYRREIAGTRPAVAGEELLRDKLKGSYRLMMTRFNRAVETQLVELLSGFDFQNVPASLFEQETFGKNYQAMSRVQIRRSLDAEGQHVRLPQMVLVEDAGAALEQGISWHLFVGTGFEGGIYSEANEVQWLAALINSKEPVGRDVLDRIENLTKTGLRDMQQGPRISEIRWYISKEGFAPSALGSRADGRNYFSTYFQLDLLHEFVVKPAVYETDTPSSAEFELVIPIEDEAELIAARTVEQIARSADFDQQAINQIKTALIEACINAAEHSDSPDRRIYQRFAIKTDRLVVTVRNKGKAFDFANIESRPTTGVVTGSTKGSRGRGLQIIRALMDEVHFERTDDGSSLVMTKFFKRPDDQ